jgi:hypothetical protein
LYKNVSNRIQVKKFQIPVAAFNKDSGIEFKPEKGQKVIILRNTFAERVQYFNYFEPLLYKCFPDLAKHKYE